MFEKVRTAIATAAQGVTGAAADVAQWATPEIVDDAVDGVLGLVGVAGLPAGMAEDAALWLIEHPRWAAVMGALMAANPIGGSFVAMGIHKDVEAGQSDRAVVGNALIRMSMLALIASLGFPPMAGVSSALAATGAAVKRGEADEGDALAVAGSLVQVWAASDGEADGAIQRTVAADADDPDSLAASVELWAEAAEQGHAQSQMLGEGGRKMGGAGQQADVIQLDDRRQQTQTQTLNLKTRAHSGRGTRL